MANFCANIIKNGWRLLANAAPQLSARNFHVLAAINTMPSARISAAPAMTTTTAVVAPNMQQTQLLSPLTTLLTQVAGFKVKGRLRRRCKDCYYVIRHQRHYIICPTHPRHKQMSMKQRDYKTWILTHATQSKVRPY